MTRRRRATRKHLATGALLLASFLEICGCNPARSCDQLRAMRLAAMPWETLVEQCAQCLTSQELLALKRTKKNTTPGGFEQTGGDSTADGTVGSTVEDALREVQGPSFYGQDESPTELQTTVPQLQMASAVTPQLYEAKPIPWPIPESVFFLYARSGGEDTPSRRIATAFVLSVPDRRHRRLVRFLVTARHVVDPEWAHCGAHNPDTIQVRLNKRTGGVGYETVRLQVNNQPKFFTSADGVSDLAVIPLTAQVVPNLEAYKLVDIPFQMLPTAVELRTLRKDQRIVTAGISPAHMAGLLDFPISDPGVLSTIAPTGQVSVQCSLKASPMPLNIWLIDARVPQGVSGAPVYTSISRGQRNEAVPVLLGIQSVVWPDKGIAGMTPSDALSDLVQRALGKDTLAMDLHKGPPE